MTIISTIAHAPSDAGVEWESAMAHWKEVNQLSDKYDHTMIHPMEAARDKLWNGPVAPSDPRWEEYVQWTKAIGYDRVMDANEKFGEQISDARIALLTIPAPHVAALRWKLEQTINDDEIVLWCEDSRKAIVGDYRRLLGGEA